MPAALLVPLITAGVTAGGVALAAHEASSGTQHAADITSAATQHGADLQKQSADAALAFQKQQAEQDYRNQEITRQANYNQHAAVLSQRSSLGQSLGLPAITQPAYVPSQDPGFTGGPTLGNPTAAAPNASPASQPPATVATGAGDPTTAALMKFYQTQGVQPTGRGTGATDIAYWADQINAHGGPTPQNLGYFTDRITQGLQGSQGGTTGAVPTPNTMNFGQMLQPGQQPLLTQPLPQPGSFGQTLGY